MRRFALFLAFAAVGASSACGMVTGLSDDYRFSDDASASDAGADVAADVSAVDGGDAGTTCTGNQSSTLANELASLEGSGECKACLQQSCCLPSAVCLAGSGGSDCKNRLACELKCTVRSNAAERAACVDDCAASDPASQAFTRVSSCDCPKCGFK